MSLTKIIKHSTIRNAIRTNLPFEPFKVKAKIKAEPQTRNFMLIGTAFDYLLRFYMERNNRKNCNVITKKWVAKTALDFMLDRKKLGRAIPILVGKNSSEDKPPLSEIISNIKKLVRKAERNHQAYINDGKITDSLLKSCIHLAQIDPYLRAYAITKDMGSINKADVVDLKEMISHVNKKRFTAKRHVLFNPTFGYGSNLVGGADADIIIDNTLIDIKTTKDPTFKREYHDQLVGYYILSLLGRTPSPRPYLNKGVAISRIGIYFSRHGVLHTFGTKDILHNPKFPKLVETFEKVATEQYLRDGRSQLSWE